MIITVAAPSDMTPKDRAEFITLVGDAGEVSLATLPGLVDQSVVLLTMHKNERLIGTAAIQRPHDGQRHDEFAKAGAANLSEGFPFELGWVVVHPDHRKNGHGGTLVMAAVDSAPSMGLYATTKSDQIRRILSRLGFVKLGTDYPSALDPTAELSLFGRRVGEPV